MNTFLARLNGAFAFTLSTMAALTFLCFLSTVMNDNMTDVKITAGSVGVRHIADFTGDRLKKDLAYLDGLGVEVDFSEVFNWNVKQLFLYLTAEYTTEKNSLNQVVLWDKILLREENQTLNISNVPTEYYFFDEHPGGLKGNDNVTLTLHWNVIPNAGGLPRVIGNGELRLQFPNKYQGASKNY